MEEKENEEYLFEPCLVFDMQPYYEIEKYYPYGNCPDSLNVVRCGLPPKVMAAYNDTTNTVKIRRAATMFNDDYLTEILMHELTHFVNNIESKNSMFQNEVPSEDDETVKKAKLLIYLFDPSEMAARVSQFKQAMKQHSNFKLSDFESVTRLSAMRSLIQMVDYDEILYTDNWSLVEVLLYMRAQRKTNLDNKPRELNTSFENFEKARDSIVKKLTKAYENYYSKICKIYYDMKNGGN
jgi:hypothetical protein